MDKENLGRNSKDAYGYMKRAEKKYHEGKTVIDHINFLESFKEAHSIEDIYYLKNEMKSYKEIRLIFTSGFFSITLPLYVILFTFIGMVATAVLAYANSLTLKLIDISMDESSGKIEDGTFDLFTEPVSLLTNKISIMILFALLGLLVLFVIRHIGDVKRMKYVAWLRTILEMKKKDNDINERME